MGRHGKLLLALSLTLNVFLIGAAAGGAYMWIRKEPGVGARPALASAARLLEPPQRQAFRQALRQARSEARADADKARAARQELAGLLAAPTLDRAAIDARLAAIRNADMAVRSRIEGVVIGFASALSPDDRRKFVDGIRGRGRLLPPDRNEAAAQE